MDELVFNKRLFGLLRRNWQNNFLKDTTWRRGIYFGAEWTYLLNSTTVKICFGPFTNLEQFYDIFII